MVKLILGFSCLLIAFEGTSQLQCKDVLKELEPNPHELLNDSISNLANPEQIQSLIDEQNLMFSYSFNLRTKDIIYLHMDYFRDGLPEGAEPLDSELIKRLEDFFKRNLNVLLQPEHSNTEGNRTIECAFLCHITTY